MRRLFALLLVVLVACSSSGSQPTMSEELPPDLVPATAEQAVVVVTRPDRTTRVLDAAAVSQVVPFLVRRVFEPTEPLASYGLDQPLARVDLTMPDGSTITLQVGDQDFDKTAYYVQRSGDGRVWLVLTDSIAPLL